MHFGTMCAKQDHTVTGVLYDMRSVYEGLSQLSDMRKAREKLSRLETVYAANLDGRSPLWRGGGRFLPFTYPVCKLLGGRSEE